MDDRHTLVACDVVDYRPTCLRLTLRDPNGVNTTVDVYVVDDCLDRARQHVIDEGIEKLGK